MTSHRRASISWSCSLCSAVLSIVGAAACAPPNLRLEGVGEVGGPYSGNAFIAPDQQTTLEGRIVNRGGLGASSPTLTFAELSCLAIDCAYSPDDIDGLAAGAGHAFAIAFTPTGCSTTTIVDWFLEADGQESRGTFDLHLQQQ